MLYRPPPTRRVVLREDRYRHMMMQEVDPLYWSLPCCHPVKAFSSRSKVGTSKLGDSKPWASPRSYGLVVRLGPEGLPKYSLHSRADGHHHGIVLQSKPMGFNISCPRGWPFAPRRFGGLTERDSRVSDSMLELRSATKRYGGVSAVEDVSIGLKRGEVHALLGENGAGIDADQNHGRRGSPEFWVALHRRQLADPRIPHEAQQMGVAMVFQETSLVPTKTVARIVHGHEKVFNRLRRINIAAQQFPAVVELRC